MDGNSPKIRSSTSVSVKGDRQYVQKLKALAALKNISLARLTRDALDTVYGHELEQSFFVDGVASKHQTSNGSNEVKEHVLE